MSVCKQMVRMALALAVGLLTAVLRFPKLLGPFMSVCLCSCPFVCFVSPFHSIVILLPLLVVSFLFIVLLSCHVLTTLLLSHPAAHRHTIAQESVRHHNERS